MEGRDLRNGCRPGLQRQPNSTSFRTAPVRSLEENPGGPESRQGHFRRMDVEGAGTLTRLWSQRPGLRACSSSNKKYVSARTANRWRLRRLRCPQQLRQLGDVDGDTPRLVLRKPCQRLAADRFVQARSHRDEAARREVGELRDKIKLAPADKSDVVGFFAPARDAPPSA
jgi:hypothetical protein